MDITEQNNHQRCTACLEVKPCLEFYGKSKCKTCTRNKIKSKRHLEDLELKQKGQKRCRHCEQVFSLEKFRKNYAICKICFKSVRQEKYQKTINLWAKDHYEKNYLKRMWYGAKARAKRENLPFEIEVSDLIIPEFCPILGIKLEIRGENRESSPSIDRIINKGGYTKDNIKIISSRANRLKSDASILEAQKILSYMKQHRRKLIN